MDILLFFVIIGYLYHFIKTQQDEEYRKQSYEFFDDLKKSNKKSNTPYLDYITKKTDKLPPKIENNKLSGIDSLSANLNKIAQSFEYNFLKKEKAKYFKSKEWNNTRKQVLTRDNNKCVLCHNAIPYAILDIHHITYKNLFHENIDELITLCQKCHKSLHENLGYPSKDIGILNKQYFWSDSLDQKQIIIKMQDELNSALIKEKNLPPGYFKG